MRVDAMMVGQIETAKPIQNCFTTVDIRTRHKLELDIRDTRFPGAQHFLNESEGENSTYQENKSRLDETTIPYRAKKQQNTPKSPFPPLITIPIKQPTSSQCQSPFLHPSPLQHLRSTTPPTSLIRTKLLGLNTKHTLTSEMRPQFAPVVVFGVFR